MRVLNGALCAVLIFFAILQYNDPDAVFWAAVYLLGALWPGLAAARPALLRTVPAARYGAYLSLALFVIGFVALAPTIGPGWIHVETAREAFGYLICAVATALAAWSALRSSTASGGALPTRS